MASEPGGTERGDPRQLFSRALDQTAHHVLAVGSQDLGNPTPCAEYDVRALLGHLVAVLDKIARVGAGGDVSDMPDVVEEVGDHAWNEAFRQARAEVERVWADEAVLDQMLTLPWARLPGRHVLDAYTHEFTVHSWDLAQAMGRAEDLDPQLGASALDWFTENMPAGSRDDHGRFDSPVSVPPDADVYTRLAAHTGRHP